MEDFDNYTIEEWIKHAYSCGYDDRLNGYELVTGDGGDCDIAYQKGWKQADFDQELDDSSVYEERTM